MKKVLIAYCISASVIVVLQGLMMTPIYVTNTVCVVLAIVSLFFWSGILLKNFFLKHPWTILAILAVAWLLGLFLGSVYDINHQLVSNHKSLFLPIWKQ